MTGRATRRFKYTRPLREPLAGRHILRGRKGLRRRFERTLPNGHSLRTFPEMPILADRYGFAVGGPVGSGMISVAAAPFAGRVVHVAFSGPDVRDVCNPGPRARRHRAAQAAGREIGL